MWSKFRKDNYQKPTFGEGVQPWDLARCPGRIESYRFIMESSIFKPILQVMVSRHADKLAVALSTCWHAGMRGCWTWPSLSAPSVNRSATTLRVENSPSGTIGTMVPDGRNPRKNAPDQLQVPSGTIMSKQGSLYNFFNEVFASGHMHCGGDVL